MQSLKNQINGQNGKNDIKNKNKNKNKNNNDSVEVLFINKNNTENKFFILDGNRKVITSISRKEFKEKDYSFIGYKQISVKFFGCTRKEAEILINRLYNKIWQSESGVISFVSSMCVDFISKITSCIQSVKIILEAVNNQAFVPLLLDILAMVSSLSNPLPNFDGFFVRILRMYSIYLRGKSLFLPQGMEEAMMLAAMLPFFPTPLVEIIKRMQLFTSRKLLDTPGLLVDFFGDLGKFIVYIMDKVPAPAFVKNLVAKIFSIGHRFRYCNTIRKLINLWKTDKRIITEQEFSVEVLKVFEDITSDYDTFQFMLGAKKQLWDDFVRLRKSVLSYRHVSRQEPFCIIFQGQPGVKKSFIMNKVVQYDQESTYVHVVKATTDGKDFYDGYDNESYFIMDDVGQMGVSQWRTIINMVSTVKLPLDCAEASLKETKFFNSEVLLVTTNKFVNLHGLTKSDGIDNLEALWRRGHVIDFDSVRRVGPDLDGQVEYKRFDVNLNTWVKDYIPGVMPEGFPINMMANNEEKLVAWISCIINYHRKFFQSVKDTMEITKSQRSIIDSYKQEFCEKHEFFFHSEGVLNWCMDSFSDLKDILRVLISELYEVVSEYLKNLKLKEVVDKTKSSMENFYNEFGNYINGIALSVLLVGVLISAYSLFFGGKSNVLESVDITKEWRDILGSKNFLAQSSNVSTVVEAVQSRMIVVELHKDDGSQEMLQAFVSGLCILLPYHVSTKGIISISGYLDFDQVDAKVKCLDHIKVSVVYQNKAADVCVLKLPEYYSSPFKCGKKLLKPIKSCDGKALIKNGNTYFINSYAKIPISRIWVSHTEDIEYYSDSYSNILKEEDRVTYCLSNNGLCGSLIVDQNLGILGMHVAGNSEKGVSILFNDSVLRDLYKLFDNNVVAYSDIPDIRKERMHELTEFSGTVLDKSYHVEVPKQTNFVPSPMLPFIKSLDCVELKKPANLQSFGSGTIHEMAKKSFQLVSGYKREELNFARSCLEVWLPSYKDISDFEVIKGNKYLPRFNMKSVNGIGYDRGKDKYIDAVNGEVTVEFKQKLEEFRNRIKSKNLSINDVVLYETLKDELRASGKEDKPRTFRISPLHLVYLMKKLYGDLAGQIIESKWDNGIAIGMNPYADWDHLYNILRPLHVFDGDVGQWDGKQPAELQDLVAEVLRNKYVGEEQELMSFFSEYLVRVNVAIMNKTVQTTHSVSSGYWMTALGNSILNRAHTSICYYRESVKMNKRPTVGEFLKIRDFVLGDDKLVGVPKELNFVNAVTMRDYFESIGMTFTDGLKNRITRKFMDLSEVSFLKRKFVYHTILRKVMCPLDKSSIYSSLCYYDKTKDYDIVMKGKMESAQRELWLHQENCDGLLEHAMSAGIFFSKLKEEYLKYLFLEESDLAWKLYLYESGKTDEYSISL